MITNIQPIVLRIIMTLMLTFKPVIIIRVVVGIIDAIATWASVTGQRHKRLGAVVVESVKRLL
jgi:hypothetical protein